MVTNFDYLKKEPKFSRFVDVAISAEKLILIDPEASILNSRRAMEFALKWMYSVDSELEMPYRDNLQSLMNAEDYRQIVGQIYGEGWITSAKVEIMLLTVVKSSEEMKRCFVWRIFLFIWIILRTVIRINMRSGSLTKSLFFQESRR